MANTHGSLSINSDNIFPIIKKWLYSDHDIFYRELISNGCDAITKLKKLELGDVLEFGHCGAYSVTEAPALFLSRQLPAIYAYSKEYGYECLREHIPAAEINLAGKK